MTPLERSEMRNYERTLGIQVQYRELPSLPRLIGLVADWDAFWAWMSTSQQSVDGPKAAMTRSVPGRTVGVN